LTPGAATAEYRRGVSRSQAASTDKPGLEEIDTRCAGDYRQLTDAEE
jgi:hypothetical protein